MMNGTLRLLQHSRNIEGQGIATKLFNYLISTYPDRKWSLSCDYDNPRAKKLYERLGFKWTEDIELYGHQYLHMVYSK